LIASTHLAVGAAAGLTVQRCLSSDASNPEKLFWAFVAGFVSHIFLDALPHQEYSLERTELGCLLFLEITAVLALLLSPYSSLLANAVVLFGIAGGAIPDVPGLAYKYVVNWPWLGNLGSKIHFCHGVAPMGFEVNFYLQSLITLAAVILVKLKSA